MKISFALKIGGSFGVILIILLITGLNSFRGLTRLNESAITVQSAHDINTSLEAIISYVKDAETSERGFIITGTERYLEPFNSAVPKIPDQLNRLHQDIKDPGQQQRLLKLESLVTQKLDWMKKIISERTDNGFDAAKDLSMTDTGKKLMQDIRDVKTEMRDAEDQILQDRKVAEARVVRNAKNTIIIFTVASLFIVIFLIIYLTVNIAMPIRKISGIAEKISEGELTIEISDTQRKDEVGVLIKTFSRMIIYLKEMTRIANMISERKLNIEIKPLSEKDVLGNAFSSMQENLKSQVLEITETVSIITAMVSEIIATSSQLTASSTETVSAITETTTTVEEVKQTAQVNNEKSKEISESSRKTVQVARDGEKAVSETGAGMDRIREQMEFIAESIMRLSEQSQSIGEIMNSINDLAEQSNLLAVNASIEAAKAGEEGKGFAVVAEEVKRLADQSKQATKQVREILTDIQKATSSAVMATEEGSKVVDAGLKQADNAGASIKVLTEVINEASLATAQIGASVQQQFVGIDQVNEAIRSISVASNQNLESTRQLEEASEKLEGVAKNMERLVEQYQI
jgi:methyl-accepting chemotaxis protein